MAISGVAVAEKSELFDAYTIQEGVGVEKVALDLGRWPSFPNGEFVLEGSLKLTKLN